MKIKHNDLIIPITKTDNPFQNCKLDRKQYAEILTNIMLSHNKGFVMALNNKWGAGKTTFVKMWKQHLDNNEFNTIYYNAWENDFEENVLIALLSEIEVFKGHKSNKEFRKLVDKAKPLVKNIGIGALKSITKKLTGGDEVYELILNGVSDGVGDIIDNEIKKYLDRKKSIEDFKLNLKTYIELFSKDSKPIVFFIDELDRCRPNYAVEVLEKIKHLFSVEGIVFVLSIDKNQLMNAIKGVYGSESIDSKEYLKRFIDLEFSLPEPNVKQFIEYLYEYYDYDSFLKSDERKKYAELSDDNKLFKDFIYLFFNETFTLRQIDQMMSRIRVILSLMKYNQYSFPGILVFIIYLYEKDANLLSQLSIGKIKLQDYINKVENILIEFIDKYNEHTILVLESKLILYYFNDLLYKDKSKTPSLITTSQSSTFNYDTTLFEKAKLANMIYSISISRDNNIKLSWIINKFKLVNDLIE